MGIVSSCAFREEDSGCKVANRLEESRVGAIIVIMHIPGLCSRHFNSESLALREGFYPSDSHVYLGLRTTK